MRRFERTTGWPIETWLHATVIAAKGTFVLELPFRDVTPNGPSRLQGSHVAYAQDIVEAIATIRIGPAPSQGPGSPGRAATQRVAESRSSIVITERETARYVEDCTDSTHSRRSCGPRPPRCTRRAD